MVRYFAKRRRYDNGDVNGDGSLNIGDAIYKLGYLFNKGPAPVAIAGGGLTKVNRYESLRRNLRSWRFAAANSTLGPLLNLSHKAGRLVVTRLWTWTPHAISSARI